MRRLLALSVLAVLGGCLCGCRNCDKVETELRARESDVRELRERLDQSEFHNQALMREMFALRGQPGPHGEVVPPSEPWPVRSLALGRQTGGQPSETLPADDALRVQVEPRDPENQTIKAPGALTIEAHEVTTEGIKRPLSVWQVSPQELRGKWQSGLITTGYVLVLPWKAWPSTEKLRVVARFQLIDGRTFEADKDITVHVLPEDKRKTLPVPAPEPAPGPAPAPTPVEILWRRARRRKPFPSCPSRPRTRRPPPTRLHRRRRPGPCRPRFRKPRAPN
jgi:hypothetical protein